MKTATFNFLDKSYEHDLSTADFDSPDTLVLAFGPSSILDDPTPLRELRAAFPQSVILGCSTAGEIHGEVINDDSLTVGVIAFEKTTIKVAYASVDAPEHSYISGEKLADELDSPALRGMIVLSDGLHVNGSRLVAGINSVVPPHIVVTGGLAGDKLKFERTWIIVDDEPKQNAVAAVGFYGDSIQIGHGSRGGWDIFGPERKVTKAKDNLLFELDGQPALELYKNYLGDLAEKLPGSALMFPLSLRRNAFDEKRLVRTILHVEENDQSMTFAGDIPEGSLVQLMRANYDRLIDGASDAAMMTSRTNKAEGEVFSIAISCVGRRGVLGERAEEELEAVLDELPEGSKQIGFYSYGEISPYGTGYCDLHNQTMTLTTLAEK